MTQTFFRLLTEALPPPPLGDGGAPPAGGDPLGGLGGPPGGGGMPPPLPMGGGMGGAPGGEGAFGAPDPSKKPFEVKTIDARDVWKILEKSLQKMDQYESLKIKKNNSKTEPKKSKTLIF